MRRHTTFIVDAEKLQGNPDASITFRPVTVGERQQYFANPANTDLEMIAEHVVAWAGVVDDDDQPMPNPADEPAIVGKLYLHEAQMVMRWLWGGPDVPAAKN